MTKQTILTKKEAEAVEWVKQQVQYKDHPHLFIEAHIQYGVWLGEAEVLTGMHPDTLIRALYLGYEIEKPKFDMGEWVTRIEGTTLACNNLIDSNRRNNRTFKIFKLHDKETVEDSDGVKHNMKFIRKSTEEEVFWAELGREYQAFKLGDVLYRSEGCGDGMYPVVEWGKDGLNILEVARVYKKGECQGFYPAESFIKFPK